MSDRSWNARVLESTRGEVLHLLRRGERTVSELAGALGLTDNAVRSHLTSLERDGLVRLSGERRGTRRPEYVYAVTPEVEHLFPKAYGLLLRHLVDVLVETLGAGATDDLLAEVGRRAAALLPAPPPDADPPARLRAAASAVETLGGLADPDPDAGLLRGIRCPLREAVDGHAAVCRLAEVILSEVSGLRIREACDRSGPAPRCRFVADGTFS